MVDTVPENFFDAIPRPTKTYHSKPYSRIAPKNFDHAGKTVLITAGATGIGYSIAASFAQSGVARLALLQRSADKLEKAKKDLESTYPKTQVVTYAASIDDYGRTEEIIKDLGSVDILVLSATAVHDMIPSLQVPTKQIENIHHTNVAAQFNFVKAFLSLSQAKTKTILNISSGSAQTRIPFQVGYGPSKAGFVQTMQHFAGELTPLKDNVRIFSYHPGAFYTPLVQSSEFKEDAFPWEDIALPGHFATWLATPEADFLHGRYLWAHWDVDELLELKGRLEKDPTFLTIGLVL